MIQKGPVRIVLTVPILVNILLDKAIKIAFCELYFLALRWPARGTARPKTVYVEDVVFSEMRTFVKHTCRASPSSCKDIKFVIDLVLSVHMFQYFVRVETV